jgi:hypothetical protein
MNDSNKLPVLSHWIALINRTEHEEQFTLNIKIVIFLKEKKIVSNGSIDVLTHDPSQYINHEQESGSDFIHVFQFRCHGTNPHKFRVI